MKVSYAVVSNETFVVLSIIEWDNTRPTPPKASGKLFPCSESVAIGDVLDTATGVFSRPLPVITDDAHVAPATASISEVAAELAQVEKSVQVLMTQK